MLFRDQQRSSDLVQAPESLTSCPNYTICVREKKKIMLSVRASVVGQPRVRRHLLCDNLALALYRILQGVWKPWLSLGPFSFPSHDQNDDKDNEDNDDEEDGDDVDGDGDNDSQYLLCARHCFLSALKKIICYSS